LGKVAVGVVREFSGHPYGAHCVVIFAIAQLSCIVLHMVLGARGGAF